MSKSRGSDATGIMYIKNGIPIISKQPIDATKFIKDVLPSHISDLEQSKIAFGHTRTPTQGSPSDNNNNHPIESDRWIMIHNGSVTKIPRIENYKYKGEVDSEVLLSYIETYGLKEGLPYVERGTASVVLMDKKDLNSIYLWREVSPIYLALDTNSNTIFWASDTSFLEKGLANKLLLFTTFQIRELPANLLIKITINPFEIISLGYIEVMKQNPKTMIPKNIYNLPYISKNSNNELLLEWNSKTHRVEARAKSVSLNSTSQNKNSQTKKYLKDHGFLESEIDRMNSSTIASIMYCRYNGADIVIKSNGDFQRINTSILTPIEDNISTEMQDKIGKIPYAGWMDELWGNKIIWQRIWKEKIYLQEVMAKYARNKNCEINIDNKSFDANKYYIGRMSKDFKNWFRLTKPNKGHLSLDGNLIKKWDTNKKSHYIITIEEAVKEKLVDPTILQLDIDDIVDIGYEKLQRLDMED